MKQFNDLFGSVQWTRGPGVTEAKALPSVPPAAPDPRHLAAENEINFSTESIGDEIWHDHAVHGLVELLDHEGWTAGDFEIIGDEGQYINVKAPDGAEYMVFRDYDDAYEFAKRDIAYMVEENGVEPSNMTEFVDRDQMRQDLADDLEDQIRESPKSYGLELDDDGNVDDAAVERKIRDELRDPVEYLRGFSDERGLAKLFRDNPRWFDTAAYAEYMVDSDGVGPTIARHDGHELEIHSKYGNATYYGYRVN